MTPVLLDQKLMIGGKLYVRGSIIELPDKDAQEYMALRIAVPAPAALLRPKAVSPEVGQVVTKEADESGPTSVVFGDTFGPGKRAAAVNVMTKIGGRRR